MSKTTQFKSSFVHFPGKLLGPILAFLVPYQQHQRQLNPTVVIPLVVEVVATCLVIPGEKEKVVASLEKTSCFFFLSFFL